MKTQKELFDAWVDDVCKFIEEVGPKINKCSASFQTPPVLDKHPDIVWLGFNPHEPYEYAGVNRERFYKGNPCWGGEKTEWKIWRPVYETFQHIGFPHPVTDGNFVLMNAFYFGSDDMDEMKHLPDWRSVRDRCLDFTSDLIRNIYKPKAVVCFSISECFNRLNDRFHFENVERFHPLSEKGEPVKQEMAKGVWGDIPVYGTVHPSAPAFGYAYRDAMARFLKKELEGKIG